MTTVDISSEKNRHLAVRVKRPGERRSLSRSATRALDVLEAFGKARRPLRAIDISRMLGLPPSTTNQLLKTMAESAHLLFDAGTKTYQPSPRLGAIASWIGEIYTFDGSLSDLVRDVWNRTGCMTTVTTPSDLFMQVIELAGPEGAGGERGLKISMFGSAIGSAFLSTLDNAGVEMLANRARVPVKEVPAILDALGAIRTNSHAAGPTAGSAIWSIAVPLPKSVLQGRGVLGIAGPGEIQSPQAQRYCGILQAAVAQWLTGQVASQEKTG